MLTMPPNKYHRSCLLDNNPHDNAKITGVIDFLLLEELVILPNAAFAYHQENMPGRRLLEK